MVDSPPIGWRPTPDAVYLVGTAGGPTGDDAVHLDIVVDAAGCLALRSNAATVVYHGSGTSQRVDVCVGAGAALDWAPQPVIVTAGAHHTQSSLVRLDPTARLDWSEMVVLGRHDENPGHADLRLDCVLTGGRPLLRHQLTIGPGVGGWDGGAVMGGNRATGMRLVAGPDLAPPAGRQGDGWAWMALDGPGWLLTAVAPDLPSLRHRMAVAG